MFKIHEFLRILKRRVINLDLCLYNRGLSEHTELAILNAEPTTLIAFDA